jgi:hypothetical protein
VLGFFAFHVAGGLFYSLIIPTAIVLIFHLLSGRRSVLNSLRSGAALKEPGSLVPDEFRVAGGALNAGG